MDENSNRILYNKDPLTYDEQIALLNERGMIIEDLNLAKFSLEQISYYRLSAYWYPLLEDTIKHRFSKNSKFETALVYYRFDKDLRKLVFSEIEKIEIAFRAKMIYNLSHKNDKYWHIDIDNFDNDNESLFYATKGKMDSEFYRSKADFANNFRKKYKGNPPSWIQFETLSFGTISKLYKILNKSNKREISNYYHLHEKVLEEWLENLVIIRNICAHHDRLWNRYFRYGNLFNTKEGKFPKLEINEKQKTKVYFRLAIIRHFLFFVNPSSSYSNNLLSLLESYPQIDSKIMGFPDNWKDLDFWSWQTNTSTS